MNEEKKSYVVVTNLSANSDCGIQLRHIITIHEEYDAEEFEKWYHKRYCKLEGDTFNHCKTMDEVNALANSLR